MAPSSIRIRLRRSAQSRNETPSCWPNITFTNNWGRPHAPGCRLTCPHYIRKWNEKQSVHITTMQQWGDPGSSDRRKIFATPLTEKALVLEQKLNKCCRTAALYLGQSDVEFSIDSGGVLVWRSIVNKATQTVVPETFRARVLYLAHHLAIARHPGRDVCSTYLNTNTTGPTWRMTYMGLSNMHELR